SPPTPTSCRSPSRLPTCSARCASSSRTARPPRTDPSLEGDLQGELDLARRQRPLIEPVRDPPLRIGLGLVRKGARAKDVVDLAEIHAIQEVEGLDDGLEGHAVAELESLAEPGVDDDLLLRRLAVPADAVRGLGRNGSRGAAGSIRRKRTAVAVAV